MPRPFLILCWCVGSCCFSFSAIPALEREITLHLSNERLNIALDKIQEQAGIIFSYPSSILDNAAPVSLQLKQKTVREALALLLPKGISYKAKNNYIILKEKPIEKNTKKTELSGYVYDKNTDRKIANVTLYDKSTLQNVTTNAYGYYSISLPKEDQCLTVKKENYRDTCVAVTYLKDSSLTNISIDPVSEQIRSQDSAYWKERLKDFSEATSRLFKRFRGYVNTINIKDTISREFQFSLLPFIGTNGLLSGNVYNKISLNVYGGFSRGTRALELGGIFNVDREKVSGAQLAGVFNIVGDSVDGCQLAGSFNITGKNMDGCQAAGFVNINLGGGSGFQGAGGGNINAKNYSGFSAAGLSNINYKSTKGLQLAGLVNITVDTLEGASLAGIVNTAGFGKRSLQVAGLVNAASVGDHHLQVAGLMNVTDLGSSDLQVGVVNRAHKLTGVQVGLLNTSDSASGVPIGFLSFVKKGVHQLELSSDENYSANLSLRTGVHSFYNLLGAGIQTDSKAPVWTFGYGIGTSFKLKNKLRADATVSIYHVSSGKFYAATSELCKFYIGLEYKCTGKFSIAAGPAFNIYCTDPSQPDYADIYSKIAPSSAAFNGSLANGFLLKGWFGGRIALRFF